MNSQGRRLSKFIMFYHQSERPREGLIRHFDSWHFSLDKYRLVGAPGGGFNQGVLDNADGKRLLADALLCSAAESKEWQVNSVINPDIDDLGCWIPTDE